MKRVREVLKRKWRENYSGSVMRKWHAMTRKKTVGADQIRLKSVFPRHPRAINIYFNISNNNFVSSLPAGIGCPQISSLRASLVFYAERKFEILGSVPDGRETQNFGSIGLGTPQDQNFISRKYQNSHATEDFDANLCHAGREIQ